MHLKRIGKITGSLLIGYIIATVVLPIPEWTLISCSTSGDRPCVRFLLSLHVDPNTGSTEKGDALMEAADHGNTGILRLLLRAGGNANYLPTSGDHSALMLACMHGDIPSARILLDNGADPNLLDGVGNSAVFYAQEYGEPALVNLLTARGGVLSKRIGNPI